MVTIQNKVEKVYTVLNQRVFDGVLPNVGEDFEIVISDRMGSKGHKSGSLAVCECRANLFEKFTYNHKIIISSSTPYFYANGTASNSFLYVMVHEMCHLLRNIEDGNGAAGHGPLWKASMIKYGSRCNDEIFNLCMVAVNSTYKNCRGGNKSRIRIIDGEKKLKYNLSCPICEFTTMRSRIGKNINAAIIGKTDHVNHDGSCCNHKLTVTQNW